MALRLPANVRDGDPTLLQRAERIAAYPEDEALALRFTRR